jgi:secondary thiamine-phosphate synthase enzyme
VKRFHLEVSTNGGGDIVDLTPLITRHAKEFTGDGLLHLFIGGSTAALTTIEHEPGLVKHDLPALFKRLAPDDASYFHEQTWHDDNGHSHLLAALFGPSLSIPFGGGKLCTGEWQQVVLIDFDTRPRRRKVVCTAVS